MTISVKKVSLAIGRDEFAWAQRRARQEGTSISAVLTEAARRMRDEDARRAKQDVAWNAFVAEAFPGEPFTEDELAAAQRELDGDGIASATAPSKVGKRRARGERRVA